MAREMSDVTPLINPSGNGGVVRYESVSDEQASNEQLDDQIRVVESLLGNLKKRKKTIDEDGPGVRNGWYAEGLWRAPEMLRGEDRHDVNYEIVSMRTSLFLDTGVSKPILILTLTLRRGK